MDTFTFIEGRAPLLVSVPHAGTHIPEPIASRMTAQAQSMPDTDWHVHQLYDFALELGASMLVATHSRFVLDLNRPSDDQNLYPGQDTTGLCPVNTFDREDIYLPGEAPDAAEISERVDQYWRPYHGKLAAELARLRETHGFALLWDAHSIRSQVPRFFDGQLPDINLGTSEGISCGAGIGERLLQVADVMGGYSAVLNGRFKGGHITRAYGDPENNIHAVQLELSQITYMDEAAPYGYREDRAEKVRPVLRALLESYLGSVG